MAKIIDEPHALDDEQLDSVAGAGLPQDPWNHDIHWYRCPACRKGWSFWAEEVPENPKCDCNLPNNNLEFEGSMPFPAPIVPPIH